MDPATVFTFGSRPLVFLLLFSSADKYVLDLIFLGREKASFSSSVLPFFPRSVQTSPGGREANEGKRAGNMGGAPGSPRAHLRARRFESTEQYFSQGPGN